MFKSLQPTCVWLRHVRGDPVGIFLRRLGPVAEHWMLRVKSIVLAVNRFWRR